MKKIQQSIASILVFIMLLGCGGFSSFAEGEIVISASDIAIAPTGGNWSNYSYIVIYGMNETAGYKINAPKKGSYHLSIKAGAGKEATVRAEIGSQMSKTGFSTGNYEIADEIYLGKFDLEAGESILRLTLENGEVYGLRSISLKKATERVETDFSRKSGAYRNHYLPTRIEAEDFDIGEGGSGTPLLTTFTSKYRGNTVIPIEATDGGYQIALRGNEWTKYTFNALRGGSYDIYIEANNDGYLEIYFDGYEGCLKAPIKTGKKSFAGTVYFDKGEYTAKIISTKVRTVVDAISFVSSDKKGVHLQDLAILNEQDSTDEELNIYKQLFVKAGSKNGDGSESKPFGTIQEAKVAVKELNNSMTGDIIVNIAPGEYEINEKIEFTNDDGGKNGHKVIYRGSNILSPPIISGGSHISGWQKTENNLWKTTVSDVEDVRQLYINGYPAQRARSKYLYAGIKDYDDPATPYPIDGQYVNKINFPVMTNAEDIEIAYNLLWTNQRVPVSNIIETEKEFIIAYDQPYYEYTRTKDAAFTTPIIGTKFYIENAYELTDEPGEFYFDKDTKEIFYYPYPEENMLTADTVIGKSEFMINVEGESKYNRIEGLSFENLDFRYGTWLDVNRTGVIFFQADCIMSEKTNSYPASDGRTLPGQVTFKNAKNVSVKNCRFQNLGSSAVVMADFVDDSTVEGNVFKDLSGSAVVVGNWRYESGDGSTPEDLCQNNLVKNNVIRRIGMEFYGCPAIGVYYTHNTEVSHNDVEDVPYTSISLGWGWGSKLSSTLDCSGHIIKNNRLVDISKTVRDGGHIYMLGEMINTVVSGNYCEKSEDFGGVYFDTGSAMITVDGNVFKDCRNWFFGGYEALNYGIVGRNNYSTAKNDPLWPLTTNEYGRSVEEATIVPDGNWTGKAKEIVDNAGLEKGYKRLLRGTEYPSWRILELDDAPNAIYESASILERYAVDYMDGGEGVGFHKVAGGDKPVEYQQGQIFVVGGTYPTEWLAFDMNVNTPGTYDFELCYALAFSEEDVSENNTGERPGASVYVDDVKVIDSIPLDSTGSWTAHLPKILGQIELSQGKHIVKVELVNNAWSFERFRLIHSQMTKTEPEFDDGIMPRSTKGE